jgi:hypothetical protein
MMVGEGGPPGLAAAAAAAAAEAPRGVPAGLLGLGLGVVKPELVVEEGGSGGRLKVGGLRTAAAQVTLSLAA